MSTHPAVLVLAAAFLTACSVAPTATPAAAPAGVREAEQLLVVTTSGWDSIGGVLHRFERDDVNAPWRREGAPVPVVVGRRGIGWGIGFDTMAAAGEPVKREGDGRAPAGVFRLRLAFGFPPADSVRGVRLPYLPLKASTECVDDTASAHYNAVIDRSSLAHVDWRSSEKMRSIPQYRVGVIVDYNASPPVRARGSCIFLHIWKGARSPTSGCTALEERELLSVMKWLDPRYRPVIVQLPAESYRRLQGRWALPALP